MNLKIYVFSASFIFTASLASGSFFQIKADTKDSKNLNEIIIDYEGYKKDRKGPVPFAHKKHAKNYGIACWDCHHDFKDGENIWVPWDETRPCIACHDPQKKDVTPIKLQRAFHYSCKRCHMKMADEINFSTDPRKCVSCHIKKE